MNQHQSTKARLQHDKPDLTPWWHAHTHTHIHACTHTHKRHTIRHALIRCNKLIEFGGAFARIVRWCTCLVSLLMWQSPELPTHWLTVWASDLTHLGPLWLGLLCLCVQTSAPMYCTVPDWAALACCRDERTHVPVMNGRVQRFGKLAARYRESARGHAGDEEPFVPHF